MKLTAIVNNLPQNLTKFGWVVARPFEGELWFYGAWYAEQEADAKAQAREVDGIVLRVEQ